MNVSGAEAVVAAASPWVGQGESACLVRPYVDVMTESEIHLTMTSGTMTLWKDKLLISTFGVRILHHCWFCSLRLHLIGSRRSESRHVVCDEHPCFDCDQ